MEREGILATAKRRWPLLFALLYTLGKLYDWLLDPIVRLNIERWAESRRADQLLVEGDRHVTSLVTWLGEAGYAVVAWAASFFASDFFLGFVAGALIFAFWDPAARYTGRLLGKGHPLSVSRHHLVQTEIVHSFSDDKGYLYDNVYGICVSNISKKTIRNLKAHCRISEIFSLYIHGTGFLERDIQPGDTICFDLGRAISRSASAAIGASRKIGNVEFDRLMNELKRDEISRAEFRLMNLPGETTISVGVPSEKAGDSEFSIIVRFTGDDIEHVDAKVVPFYDKEKERVGLAINQT